MAPSVDLNEFEQALQKEGFETALDDNVLSAQKDSAGETIEVTLDAGGGCLLKKTRRFSTPVQKISYQGKSVPVISTSTKTSQVRVIITNSHDLEALISLLTSHSQK